MSKTEKDVARELASAFSEDELVPTTQTTEWSMSFKSQNGEDEFGTLKPYNESLALTNRHEDYLRPLQAVMATRSKKS